MYLSQIATFCSHLKFKRPLDDKFVHFDEHEQLCSDDGRPLKVTKKMLEDGSWDPNCDHPRESILIESTTKGTLFQCKECLQMVMPTGFTKCPPPVPDVLKPQSMPMGYRDLNREAVP